MLSLQQTFQNDHPVALVTGSGAPRVGRAIATEFARAGCRIALHAHASGPEAERAAEELRREYAVDVIATFGSLDDDAVPERLVAETVNALGRIDILINSAAIWKPTPLEQVTAAEVRRYFEINTLASFLCARAAGLRMVEQTRGGAIVNLGDWATIRPYLDHAAYFPSKGAVEVMTRSLAVELAQRNPDVRVNCIQPGPVLLAEDVTADDRQRLAASTLRGRIGTPEAIAHAARMLCENDFLTGVCLPVDGGRAIYAPDGLQAGRNTG